MENKPNTSIVLKYTTVYRNYLDWPNVAPEMIQQRVQDIRDRIREFLSAWPISPKYISIPTFGSFLRYVFDLVVLKTRLATIF